MADDPNWNYWNDIKMAWDRLEFVLMKQPEYELTDRERSFVEDWQRATEWATEQAGQMYSAYPPGYRARR